MRRTVNPWPLTAFLLLSAAMILPTDIIVALILVFQPQLV